MKVRDRIKDLRRVRAADLKPSPHNWRVHPVRQQAALRDMLSRIGYAEALLARECEDGSLELIDGHLRAQTTPDQEVPVLVLDIDEREAKQLLLTIDPLADLAEADAAGLERLKDEVDIDSPAVNAMLGELLEEAKKLSASADIPAEDETVQLSEGYKVLVECEDEAQQAGLLQRLSEEGFPCRALIA